MGDPRPKPVLIQPAPPPFAGKDDGVLAPATPSEAGGGKGGECAAGGGEGGECAAAKYGDGWVRTCRSGWPETLNSNEQQSTN